MSSFCFERSSCRFWWRRKSHAWKRRIQPDLNKKPWEFPKTSLFKVDGFLLQNRWTLEGLMNFRAGFSFLLLFFVGFQVATELDAVEVIGVDEHHVFYHSKIKHRTCWTSWILCTIFYPTIFRSRYTTIHLGGSLSGRVWNNFWTLSKLDNLILFNFSIPLAVWRIWKHQWITWFQTKAAWNWSSWEAEVKPWKFSHS